MMVTLLQKYAIGVQQRALREQESIEPLLPYYRKFFRHDPPDDPLHERYVGSKARIAKKLGISRSTVNRVLSGASASPRIVKAVYREIARIEREIDPDRMARIEEHIERYRPSKRKRPAGRDRRAA
jgi:transcriptional regulator with XRE-family HTH domain